MSEREWSDRVYAALRDDGATVLRRGTVERDAEGWLLRDWDVEFITRERAIKVAQDALNK